MQSRQGFDDLARRVVPIAQRHGIEYISLIPPGEGIIADDEGKVHLLLNLDGADTAPDFDALADEIERSIGHPIELYTLESIRHSLYGKDIIRRCVMLTATD